MRRHLMMNGCRRSAAVAMIFTAGCALSATAGTVEETQELPWDFPLSPNADTLQFGQFNTFGGARVLQEVRWAINGEFGAEISAENDSPLEVTDFGIVFIYQLSSDFETLALDCIGNTFTLAPVVIAPSDGIDDSGPDFFDFGFLGAGCDEMTATTTMLEPFIGTGTVDCIIDVAGGYSVAGSTDSTINVVNFDTTGSATVTYVFTEIPGACCLPDGSCEFVVRSECIDDLDGVYQGPDVPCDDVDCPQPGPCCFIGEQCEILPQAECIDAGGEYPGVTANCQTFECDDPSGACCFNNGQCTYIREFRCIQQGGSFQGNFIPCIPNPCETPDGACCLPNETCTPLPQSTCENIGGVYAGPSTSCAVTPCVQLTAGACCKPNGICTFVAKSACESTGGLWQGTGTLCDPDICATESCVEDCSPQNPDGSVGNGVVNVDDFFAVLLAFGQTDSPCDVRPINEDGSVGNGLVNVDDLIAVLLFFGPCGG